MFGPLPIRILAGITFIAHGLPKFENIAGTQDFFGSIGLPPEWQYRSFRGNWWNVPNSWCTD